MADGHEGALGTPSGGQAAVLGAEVGLRAGGRTGGTDECRPEPGTGPAGLAAALADGRGWSMRDPIGLVTVGASGLRWCARYCEVTSYGGDRAGSGGTEPQQGAVRNTRA